MAKPREVPGLDCEEPFAAAAARIVAVRSAEVFEHAEGVLDVERDHGALIDACARLLSPGGCIVFSTNAQRFRLDESIPARFAVKDVSAATLPRDFERNPRIHRCFEIRPLQPPAATVAL